MKKSKRKYLCGCTVHCREDNRGVRKFSIFPACADLNCMTRQAVRCNHVLSNQNTGRNTNTGVLSFPLERVRYPIQNHYRNKRTLQAMQQAETDLDSYIEDRCKSDM